MNRLEELVVNIYEDSKISSKETRFGRFKNELCVDKIIGFD